jgi:hypothetical protein
MPSLFFIEHLAKVSDCSALRLHEATGSTDSSGIYGQERTN